MCVVKPEQTEGPFYVDTQLDRADIRVEPASGEIKPGIPLVLNINVSALQDGVCTPLPEAVVDIWHCDAGGVYSGVKAGRMQPVDTSALKFLRGYQVTDGAGKASFLTIVPGWYQGRTTHIHFKVRCKGLNREDYEFTSQLYFDDAFSQLIYTHGVYIRDSAQGTTNRNDGIFRHGGEQLMLRPVPLDSGSGYLASFDIALDLADTQTGRPDDFSLPG